jgi:branched-chain amino acid transport system ATP-binding protein
VIELASLLEVRDLAKSFGGLKALDGVTLSVEKGSLAILIGPNGSGKTTLINTVCGFYKPDRGQVFYDTSDITGWAPHKVYAVGVARTFQVPSIFLKLTVLENLLVAEKGNPGEGFVKSLNRKSWEDREAEAVSKAGKLLQLLSLSDHWDRQAYALSGGQMKLLEIGRALMSGANLLLLDEPVSGVNPTLAHEIFARLVKLRDEMGLTLLIVEHRLDIAAQYVDAAHALAFGRLIASGKPQDVLSDARVVEAYLGA